MDEQVFDVAEAQALLAEHLPALREFVALRADAAEIAAALATGDPSPHGGLPELKAAEARCDEILAALVEAGVHVKGVAPLLLDFPAVLDGVSVLLCWLEGDEALAWYHRADLGFVARRPLPG